MSGTSIVHPDATLTPTKQELYETWLPKQEWFTGNVATAEQLGTYRLVDPDGEVGLEGFLLRDGDNLFHWAWSYRGERQPGHDADLVGTMSHSHLGERFVYEAQSDSVFISELIRVIREGDTGASLHPDGHDEVPTSVTVEGTGIPTVADMAGVVRLLHDAPVDAPPKSRGLLIGRFDDAGETREVVLAFLK